MHDYHKALDMVNFAKDKAAEIGKERVTEITVSIGESSGYTAESILMYFKEVSAGTLCEGAKIVFKPVPSMLECPACGEVFERRFMRYQCPKCGVEGIPSEEGTKVVIEGIQAQ